MTATRQPRRSRKQWQALIQSFQNADLSIEQFCQQQNISPKLFNKWHHFFTTDQNRSISQLPVAEQNSTPAFIDLASLTGQQSGWNIVLSLGNGVELKLSQQ